jgi:hypothetical protein
MDKVSLRSLPGGVLGAIGLVVAVELFVTRHELDFTSPESLSWRSSRSAAGKTADCDILCLGSSMVQQGLFPRVIEHRTGKRAYNLAVVGGHAPCHYYLLKRSLDAGARPSAVFVDFHPFFITGSHKYLPDHWPNLLGPLDCLEMAWNARDPIFFAKTLLTRFVPTLNDRHQIRGRILAALLGEKSPARSHLKAFKRNLARNRGAFMGVRNPGYAGDISARHKEELLSDHVDCDPLQRLYIEKLLSLAAAHRVTVY